MPQSPEQRMYTEPLLGNQQEIDPYFGEFFTLMRRSLVSGGSELGLGMSLFSLSVSIQATTIIEIGRFKGFSTLCLASALKFLDLGCQEPLQHKQRLDVDYAALESAKTRRLFSIDPFPTIEATQLIQEAQLTEYVEFINQRSTQLPIFCRF